MKNETTPQVSDDAQPALRALDVLVGAWTIAGEAQGETVFSWLEGGLFLEQRSTIVHEGVEHHALEIIGCEKPFGATRAADVVTSRAYTDTGDTLDYTYELEGDTLTIWGGSKGSPAYSQATLDDQRRTLTGAWHWPGGGYTFRVTRAQ